MCERSSALRGRRPSYMLPTSYLFIFRPSGDYLFF